MDKPHSICFSPNDNTNARGGKDCADELYNDDGRYTYDDPAYHKGNWGKHPDKDPKDLPPRSKK